MEPLPDLVAASKRTTAKTMLDPPSPSVQPELSHKLRPERSGVEGPAVCWFSRRPYCCKSSAATGVALGAEHLLKPLIHLVFFNQLATICLSDSFANDCTKTIVRERL